jgi:hypothetical protein
MVGVHSTRDLFDRAYQVNNSRVYLLLFPRKLMYMCAKLVASLHDSGFEST